MKKKQKQENTDDPEENDTKEPETHSVQERKNGAANPPLKRGQKVMNLPSKYSHVIRDRVS